MHLRRLVPTIIILLVFCVAAACSLPLLAQDSDETQIDHAEQERQRLMQEQMQRRMNEQIRKALAEMPPERRLPDYLRYKVNPNNVERLCDRLGLSDEARALARTFYEEFREQRWQSNLRLIDLLEQEYGFKHEPHFPGETEPQKPLTHHQRATFLNKQSEAIAEDLERINRLFEEIAALAVDLSEEELTATREHWEIDILLNPGHTNAPFYDLGARINLLDVLEGLAAEDADLRDWLEQDGRVGEILTNYRTELVGQVQRRAEMYPQLFQIEQRANNGDESAADRLGRIVDSLWKAYWSLNETTAHTLAEHIAVGFSPQHAERFRLAVRSANFPSTYRIDAAERMYEWLIKQPFVVESDDDTLRKRLEELIEQHRRARAVIQPRSREIAFELRALSTRGAVAMYTDETWRRTFNERSDLNKRHREIMSRTIDFFRGMIPEEQRDGFNAVVQRILFEDSHYSPTGRLQ